MIPLGTGVDSGLLGSYYTAESVIIVYHLLSLQHWLDQVTLLEGQAETVRATTPRGDLARTRLRSRCQETLRRYPWFQVLLLLLAVGALSALALAVAGDLNDIAWIYAAGPTVVLLLVFATASIGAWLRGRSLLRAVMARVSN